MKKIRIKLKPITPRPSPIVDIMTMPDWKPISREVTCVAGGGGYADVPTSKRKLKVRDYNPLGEMVNADPLPPLEGQVDRSQFELALKVYNLNQTFYLTRLNSPGANRDLILYEARKMEDWLMLIVPPPPPGDRKEWILDEKDKFLNGRTVFCHPDLASVIGPAPGQVLEKLTKIHKKLF